ncbi:MAG: hypothetical protein KI793_16235 [Rivularia sp. (in: Bacteria)]|nr:hypothetical protein [Rivularia sp. MS3]
MLKPWTFGTVLALLLMPSTVLAQRVGSVYWQSNGGGCVPTDKTIRSQQYWTVTGAGRVKYRGNGTQPLVFSCPVSNINSNVSGGGATILRLFYQDPDGSEDAFQVEATLKSFAKSNGAYNSEVCKVTSNKTGQWQDSISDFCRIDMGKNIYWVEVKLKRTRPSNSVVEFNGVSLESRIL